MKQIILSLMIITLILIVSCAPPQEVPVEESPEETEISEALEELDELDVLGEEEIDLEELDNLPLE